MKFLTTQTFTASLDDDTLGDGPVFDPNAPAVTRILDYVLSASTESKFLKFQYTATPKGYKNNDKKPLMLRVPEKGCEIRLTLDDSIYWRFPVAVPAIRLGKKSNSDSGLTDPVQRYKNYDVSASQKSLTFNAPHVDIKDSTGHPIQNFDSINIIVEIAQVGDDGATPSFDKPLVLIIDPDIKNPGDDTLPVDI